MLGFSTLLRWPLIMTIPHKSLAVRTAEDFFYKLVWENKRLHAMPNDGSDEFAYQFINCALTAWHMVDWAFQELPPDEAARFRKQADFRAHLREICRYLAICREIADGSKHARITRNPDPDIGTTQVAIDLGNEELTKMWMVQTGLKFDDPKQVARSLENFWRDYLGIGKDL